eukprot:CAMPEP_0197290106 /NCGR_PEP_ID=MMETSP0890-20130614/7344_1 /TAXON_ID=44058 ORGANISM="Aureoumbra lagunensis, Strain CCMP1510" /NCGR_SAMPLE_ID=MMETSP0890 /ASSEMBLY_ACC=CAM_ASM_000533 /LENGTH=401 /DNA_ID=CAMNT_0042761915 /DNA_START=1 /DNA_END=1206 /DNA_ORIENTATION=-
METHVRQERLSQALELEETASPNVIRALIAEERNGATKDELRAKYAELEYNEQCWVSVRLTKDERDELIAAAQAVEENKDSIRARNVYRATYCRIRDDVVLREKLSRMNESQALAWRQADAMEKQGLAPQQVANELRSRLGVSQEYMDAVTEATRLRMMGTDEAQIKTTLKKLLPPEYIISDQKPTTKNIQKIHIQRGFLLHNQNSKRNASSTSTTVVNSRHKFETNLTQVLQLNPALCREALTGAIALYSAQQDRNMNDFAQILECASASARSCSSSDQRLDVFLAAVARLTILPPYKGPKLKDADIDFMLDIYRRRTAGKDDDEELRGLVLKHVQKQGPAFLQHMTQAAHLLDGIQDRIHNGLLSSSLKHVIEEKEDDNLQLNLRAHLYAYFVTDVSPS